MRISEQRNRRLAGEKFAGMGIFSYDSGFNVLGPRAGLNTLSGRLLESCSRQWPGICEVKLAIIVALC